MRHRGAILCLILLLPALAFAQVNTALLQGRVIDDGGAAIAGATVEAHQRQTGLRRTTTTEASGAYRLAALPIGPYEITATAPGFGGEIRSGVTLAVGQQATVDFRLKVAATAENITVTAEAPIIERTESAIGTAISTRQIDELPLPNRDFTELASLTPGIQHSFTENGAISANGGSGSSNTFIVDGVSGDAEALGGQRTALSPDVVAEFEVLSGQYSAEFGRASGAVINVVTRSGSNDVQGRLATFYRDDSLTSDNPFAVGGEKTPFSQKVFSTFLGGPIKRDRAFYFASYERTDSDTSTLVTVNPAVLAALGQDTRRVVANPTLRNRALGKLDFSLASTNQLGLRLDFDDTTQKNFAVGALVTIEAGATEKLQQRDAVLSDTSVVNARVLNDLRLLRSTSKTDVTDVNCPHCPFVQRPSVQTGKLPNFPQLFEEKRTELVEAVTLDVPQRAGDHTFKAGVEGNRLQLPVFVPQYFDGAFQFTTDKPFNPSDQSTYPQLYISGTGNPSFVINDNFYGVYVQDQWRVNPRLTLNLGLRWDYEDHVMVKHDKDNFAPRLHFAWDPTGTGKTIVRGGGGVYYDTIFLNAPLIGQLLSPDRFQQQFILSPGYPDPRVGGAQIPLVLPPSIALTNTDSQTPHNDILGLGLSREMARDLAFTGDLVLARGHNLLLLLDRNAPVNKVRPDSKFAQKLSIETRGRSEYKALELGLRKRFGGRFALNAAYTLAKNENSTDSHRAFVNDSNNPEANFGSSLNDVRHTFNAAMNFSAPWGVQVGLGGSFRSGAPYNITTGKDDNGDQVFNDRPPGVKRNSARGPATSTVNLRLTKLVKVSALDVEIIGEAFNVFDRTNETGFVGNMLSAQFGRPTNVLDGAFGPRQFQLGLRLDF